MLVNFDVCLSFISTGVGFDCMCMQERISLLFLGACNLSAMFFTQYPTRENCVFLRNYLPKKGPRHGNRSGFSC